MIESDLLQVYILVFFVYGLAFFGMGIAMALELGRSPVLVEAPVLLPLAVFGILHGAHEWFESYLIQVNSVGISLPDWIPWLRLGLLVLSFLFLFVFAYNLLRLTSSDPQRKPATLHGIYWIYIVAFLANALLTYRGIVIPWLDLLDAMARYVLAVPASVLAALALRARSRQAHAEGLHVLQRSFFLASLGFGIYAFTQFFVHRLGMFPGFLVNQEEFLALTGIPIQLVRAFAAVLIASGLLRSAQIMEAERTTRFSIVQQARLEALQQRESLRRELLRHIVQAQEDERGRIARELHDETAQSLTAFSLELAALKTMLKTQKAPKGKVERLQDLSRSISQGLYRLVHDLRPAQLDDLGLVHALKYLLEQDCSSKGLQVVIEVDGSARRLDPLAETVLFRVAQEALNNVIRHAQTDHARLSLSFEPHKVGLRLVDRGRGFNTAESFTAPRGWGLAGMRERVESLGGEFHLNSSIGQGTAVEVVIPLEK